MRDRKAIGVLGIGNVLMGDDGIGPFVVKVLEARYEFPVNVELRDLGTPGLGITSFFSEYDVLILVDAVHAKAAAGDIRLYRKQELVQVPIKPRVSPHDPALVEALLFAEFSGKCPSEVLLVGVVPEACELGCCLSPVIEASVDVAVAKVVEELQRLGIDPVLRLQPPEPAIWWEKGFQTEIPEGGPVYVPGHSR